MCYQSHRVPARASFSTSHESAPILWQYPNGTYKQPQSDSSVAAACSEHALSYMANSWAPPSWSIAPIYTHGSTTTPPRPHRSQKPAMSDQLCHKSSSRHVTKGISLRSCNLPCQHWLKRQAHACAGLVRWLGKAVRRKKRFPQSSSPSTKSIHPMVHPQARFLWNELCAWSKRKRSSTRKPALKHVRFVEEIMVHSVERLEFVEIVGEMREPAGPNPNWSSIGQSRARRLQQFGEQLKWDQVEGFITQWRNLSQPVHSVKPDLSFDPCFDCFIWEEHDDRSWGSDDDVIWASDGDEDM